MLLLLPLLLSQASALSPGGFFPTCLQAGVTWDQDEIYNLSLALASPEACQQLCSEDEACRGFTWLSAEAPLLGLSCSLFDQTDTEVGCEDCVSGPAEPCRCRMDGECQIQEDNLIESRDGLQSAADCELACVYTQGCNFFTFLEEGHAFRGTCFLFSSCEVFDPESPDCTTGPDRAGCNICSFKYTAPSGECKATCEEGWSLYNNACYGILSRYSDIDFCRNDCDSKGGQLGSVHSDEENSFIKKLLRNQPQRAGYGEQATWLGALLYAQDQYVWEDGTSWDYTNWAPGQPEYPESHYGGSCLIMGWDNPEGQWDNGACEWFGPIFDCLCKLER